MSSHTEHPSSLVATDGRKIKIGDLTLDIISVGGYYTCIQLPKHKIVFDMGICPKEAFRSKYVFFTHPHPDHMSGFIQHLSTREMIGAGKSTYVMEDIHVAYFEDILNGWRRISRCSLQCEIVGITQKEEFSVSKNHLIVPFRSVHRIPCLGYTLFHIKKKLLPEFQGQSSQKIIAAKSMGKDIHLYERIPLVSVTGDTTHHVFERNPEILKSNVLVTEVTFFGDDVSPEQATAQGHMHINDLIRFEDAFLHTKLVIMHISARYKTAEVEEIVRKRFSKRVHKNITIVPNTMIV